MFKRLFILALTLHSLTCSGVETTSLNASKALAILSNFTSLFKPVKLSFAANASNLNKALSKSTRVYPQVGSAVPPTPVKLGDYVVGEFKQGGVVIWVTEDGEHGLVASIVNLGPTTGPDAYTLTWGPTSKTTGAKNNNQLPLTYTPGTTPKENYSGYQNQQIIEAITDWESNYPAFAACKNYSITIEGKTYDDWFLPTSTELQQIYNQRLNVNRVSQANGGEPLDTPVGGYWSSREYQYYSDRAWFLDSLWGDQNARVKDLPYAVRCVRAF